VAASLIHGLQVIQVGPSSGNRRLGRIRLEEWSPDYAQAEQDTNDQV